MDDSSTEGRAKAHKEEGNEQFRLKHYQKAVDEYSAGVKEGVELRNEEGKALLAILYTNRAAAQFHLGECVCAQRCPEKRGDLIDVLSMT